MKILKYFLFILSITSTFNIFAMESMQIIDEQEEQRVALPKEKRQRESSLDNNVEQNKTCRTEKQEKLNFALGKLPYDLFALILYKEFEQTALEDPLLDLVTFINNFQRKYTKLINQNDSTYEFCKRFIKENIVDKVKTLNLDIYRMNLLDFAVHCNHELKSKILKMHKYYEKNLASHLESTRQPTYSHNIYSAAIKSFNLDLIKLLLSNENNNLDTSILELIAQMPFLNKDSHEKLIEILRLILTQMPNISYRNESGDTALHIAARNGHIEIVRELLNKEPSILKIKNHLNNRTALHYAIQNGHLEVVKEILKRDPGSIVDDCIEGFFKTPNIILAARNGHIDIIEKLLKKSPKQIEHVDENRNTLLHIAAKGGYIIMAENLILKKPEFINTKNETGEIPLHIAAQNGHKSIFKELLARNPESIDKRNKAGLTPLHFAAQNGHLEIVKEIILIKPACINFKDSLGFTPLHYAAERNSLQVVKKLLDKNLPTITNIKNNSGLIPLHYAARYGCLEITKELLNRSPNDINSFNKEGLLYEAIKNNHLEVFKELLKRSPENNISEQYNLLKMATNFKNIRIVEELLNINPSLINFEPENKLTFLHIAADKGYLDLIKMILDKKPSLIKTTDIQGNLPLHYASRSGHRKVVVELLERDPESTSIRNKDLDTAFNLARKYDLTKKSTHRFVTIEFLLRGTETDKMIALFFSAKNNDIETFKLLIKEDPSRMLIIVKNSITILHLAALVSNIEIVKEILKYPQFIDIINILDSEGYNPLHLAALHNRPNIIKELLEKNLMLIKSKTAYGKTAIELAIEANNQEAIQELRRQEELLERILRRGAV